MFDRTVEIHNIVKLCDISTATNPNPSFHSAEIEPISKKLSNISLKMN
jgi:hypothetical protein